MIINFVKTREGAITPAKKSNSAAAFDLYTPADILVNYGRNVIKTGIALELPEGAYADIRPRSGLSVKGMEGVDFASNGPANFDCDVILGTIDSDYRGEVGVIMNNRDRSFVIPAGTRIAQLLINSYPVDAVLNETKSLSTTERGAGGFGSTGSK